MSLAAVFFFSAVFSFMGSAPPGVLNMYAFQLGLQKKKTAAVRFALAVGISEFIFAWIALRCAHWIVSVPAVARYFHYMTAAVLTIMGIAMLAAASRPQTKERKSGFRKGLLLSLLNPMVVPFWIGISAYMQLRGWLRAEEFIDVFRSDQRKKKRLQEGVVAQLAQSDGRSLLDRHQRLYAVARLAARRGVYRRLRFCPWRFPRRNGIATDVYLSLCQNGGRALARKDKIYSRRLASLSGCLFLF